MAFTYTATVLPILGKPYKVSSGPAATKADGKAEVAAILATVVGVEILKVTVTEDADVTTEALALHGDSGAYEDAVINLRHGGILAGTFKTRSKKVNNMSADYALEADPSLVDTTNADIIAIETSYRDGSGVNGYTFDPAAASFFEN